MKGRSNPDRDAKIFIQAVVADFLLIVQRTRERGRTHR
jgi:hypothetical protein